MIRLLLVAFVTIFVVIILQRVISRIKLAAPTSRKNAQM